MAFYTGVATLSFKQILNCIHEAEWTPFQTQYFSENLVVLGIEPELLDLKPGTLTTRPQRRFFKLKKKREAYNFNTVLLVGR
jgi:hypothetical protein